MQYNSGLLFFKNKKNNYFVLILRILLIIVFASSFIFKILTHFDFAEYTGKLIDSFSFGILLSNIILAIELYLVLQLIISKNIHLIISQSFIVLIVFTIILILSTNSSRNCYCFGEIFILNTNESIIKNLILILIILITYKKQIIINIIQSVNKHDFLKLLFSVVVMCVFFQSPKNLMHSDVNAITVNELKQLSVREVLIIDARDNSSYKRFHIPNSINVPYQGQKELNNILPLNGQSKIVVYCDGLNCSLAKNLAKVIQREYPNITTYYLKGGLEKWEKI